MTTDQAITLGYFDTRLQFDKRRQVLWQTLCEAFFQNLIPDHAAVLEIGSGYGDFINNIRARKKYALDIWEGFKHYLDRDVEGHCVDMLHLDFIPDNSLDMIFASNVFEHVSKDKLAAFTEVAGKKLKSNGGKLVILQPNFKYCAREYFDDYTHETIYTDVSLADFLSAKGFEIKKVYPKFLPLSIKSRLPVSSLLIRLYLKFPIKVMGKQMLVIAQRKGQSHDSSSR